ncbi:hypothetical protein BED41_05335 [Cloacibacillus porcorum]|uniref:Uncharacterized protein n=1 Tax=Cloacibacillus porcorum TaxID=1197717 RepID=A0A1B2I3L6_9BACT|nr:hypothetical protein BED41_05335 [Cloacibacillus porcorum]
MIDHSFVLRLYFITKLRPRPTAARRREEILRAILPDRRAFAACAAPAISSGRLRTAPPSGGCVFLYAAVKYEFSNIL